MTIRSHFDFIFLGAGCASLSLLLRLIRSEKFGDKKILLIDKDAKKSNDRTWCFWEKENGFFDEIVFRKWNTISFLSDDYNADMKIAPYQYKMIRGIDFYEYCFKEISKHRNIEFVQANIDEWDYQEKLLSIKLNDAEYRFDNTILFSSIYKGESKGKKAIKLLQHFKGWIIETQKSSFDTQKATMMDFRINQDNGTSFVYVLPFDEKTALVEYTLFTKQLLEPEEYDEQLKNYIKSFLGIEHYKVSEIEFGVIPMTNEKFSFESNGWNIGTAGGQTKASSGYTFQFIQKKSQQIADCLIAGKSLKQIPQSPRRFNFYDNTLLEILYHNKLPGKQIFTTMFKKNKPQQVLRFLDNESSVKDELKIISSLPTWPFLKAAIKQL